MVRAAPTDLTDSPAPPPSPDALPEHRILGIDLGLRTGYALFGPTAGGPVRLIAYGSQHIGNRQALRKAAVGFLDRFAPVDLVVVEGDAALGRIWQRAADFRHADLVHVHAERWRTALLLDRLRRNGRDAKKHADALALQVIDWSRADGSAAPAAVGDLRHDTAEAILIGLWGAIEHSCIQPAEVPWQLPQP